MDKRKELYISLPKTSASELMGKQSVRATFRLSSDAIRIMSIVSAHMGIKQKSLFDHLAEDENTLQKIAAEIREKEILEKERIPKTFVLSRRTLTSLEETSRNCNAPRDALVEYSIMRLRPLLSKEREKHRQRCRLLEKSRAWLRAGEKILDESEKSLGKEDPFHIRLEKALGSFRNAHRRMTAFVEKGDAVEDGK